MKRPSAGSLVWVPLVLSSIAYGQDSGPLRLVQTVPLPDYVGDFEHFAADIKGNRLFVIAEDHKTVEVLDPHSAARISTITGFAAPHGIAYLPGPDKVLVASGNDELGEVDVVSGADYKIIDQTKLPPGVDCVVYNPVSKYFYVESENTESGAKTHVVSIIDTEAFKKVGEITLPGAHSEAMVIDKAGKKMYVNLARVDEIGVVDLETNKLVSEWPIPGAHSDNAMAFDEPDHRLFTASHNPPKLFVFDTDTGKVIFSHPCAYNSDDMSYDPTHKRIYITGDGATSVFQQQDADHYDHVVDILTGYRARTSTFVPEWNRLYVAVGSRGQRKGGRLVAPEPGSKVEVRFYEAEP
jgi:DNA-binding beta-propeller fold protein YncE